jgi:intraflagellar transport protein 122
LNFLSKILYTASKMGKELQAYKFARTVLERVDELVVANKFSEEIDSLSMSIKAKPFKDDEELLPLCYRCSHHNPLWNPKGNDCTNCGQPYVFSFASFELLPLVEFVLPDRMSDEEALSLIDQVPNSLFEKDANARFVAASAAAAGMNKASKSRF